MAAPILPNEATMPDTDLKRTLDEALSGLGEMHHALVAELQKANEDDAQDYVKFLDAQIKSVAHVSQCVEKAGEAKSPAFV
jgi:hypothetical protein